MKGYIYTREKDLELEPFEFEQETALDTFQEIVKGNIECFYSANGIALYCNEEGKFMNLDPTLALVYGGEVSDIVMGNIILVGSDKEGNDRDVTEEDIFRFNTTFHPLSRVLVGGKTVRCFDIGEN